MLCVLCVLSLWLWTDAIQTFSLHLFGRRPALSSSIMWCRWLTLLVLHIVHSKETFFEGDFHLSNEAKSHRSSGMVLRWPRSSDPYVIDILSKFMNADKEVVRQSIDLLILRIQRKQADRIRLLEDQTTRRQELHLNLEEETRKLKEGQRPHLKGDN